MTKKEINIHINGESKKIKAEKSIEMLLKELNLNKILLCHFQQPLLDPIQYVQACRNQKALNK